MAIANVFHAQVNVYNSIDIFYFVLINVLLFIILPKFTINCHIGVVYLSQYSPNCQMQQSKCQSSFNDCQPSDDCVTSYEWMSSSYQLSKRYELLSFQFFYCQKTATKCKKWFNVVKTKWWIVQKQSISSVCYGKPNGSQDWVPFCL